MSRSTFQLALGLRHLAEVQDIAVADKWFIVRPDGGSNNTTKWAEIVITEAGLNQSEVQKDAKNWYDVKATKYDGGGWPYPLYISGSNPDDDVKKKNEKRYYFSSVLEDEEDHADGHVVCFLEWQGGGESHTAMYDPSYGPFEQGGIFADVYGDSVPGNNVTIVGNDNATFHTEYLNTNIPYLKGAVWTRSNIETELSSGVTAGAKALPVDSTDNFPNSLPLDDEGEPTNKALLADDEMIWYDVKSGDPNPQFGDGTDDHMKRGVLGTAAAAHDDETEVHYIRLMNLTVITSEVEDASLKIEWLNNRPSGGGGE